MGMIATGIGYDVHRLVSDRPLVLGGVRIDHPLGLEGHSDADVLCHAIADALLGAAGEPDIGHMFPNTDPSIRGISSLEILRQVHTRLMSLSVKIHNIDATLIAEEPKISPYLTTMKSHIGEALGLPPARVGIKATTNESLGFLGRCEGIAALATACVDRPEAEYLSICDFRRERTDYIPTMKSFLLALTLAAAFAGSLVAQTLSPLPPDGFVTLEQIVKDFASSEDAALKKYDGMRILVYGRVGDVTQSSDASGDPLTVFMQLPNQTTPDVKAVFGADDLPTANVSVDPNSSKVDVFHRNWEGALTKERAFIVEGENTGIRGTFDNFVAGDIVLKNCNKLQTSVLMKKLAEHGIPTE